MKKLLVLDFNNLLFRYLDIHKDLYYRGKRTGGLFGFLQQLCCQVNLHEPDAVVCVTDKKPYLRNKFYKDYKKKEHHDFDQAHYDYVHESIQYCKTLLEMLNIPLWQEEGYEADDLMAILVYKYKYRCKEIILVSNDEDLYSLLHHNVSIQRNKELFTYDMFFKKYGIDPSAWVEILAMKGTHNNVPQLYRGLGLQTALKFIKNPEKMKDIIMKYEEQYTCNLILTLLPVNFNVDFKIPDYRTLFSFLPIERMLMNEFGIQITKAMTDAFFTLNQSAMKGD